MRSSLVRPADDWLFRSMVGTAVLLGVVYVVLIHVSESLLALDVLPWFTPLVSAFYALSALSIAYLALGRYHVLRDPGSYWVGLGFATFAIAQVFRVLVWPGLLPDGQSLFGHFSSTPAWIGRLGLCLLGIFLLAAALVGRPAKQPSRRALGWAMIWFLVVIFIDLLLIALEQDLPMLVTSTGAFTPPHLIWDVGLVLLFAIGAVLSTRCYLHSDAFLGYVAFCQVAMAFGALASVIATTRYDLWWYLSRLILLSGPMVVLFGLLSEYMGLFRREQAKTCEAQARFAELQGVLKSIPDVVFVTDEQGDVRFASQKALDLLGIQSTQDLSQPATESPDLHETRTQGEPLTDERWLLARVARGESFQSEKAQFRDVKTGSNIWLLASGSTLVDQTGKPVGGLVVATDITERKRAQEALQQATCALRESEKRLSVIQEAFPDGFLIFKPRHDARGQLDDLLFVYENAAAGCMNGTAPEQVAGHGLFELFPRLRGSAYDRAYRQVLETHQATEFEDHSRGESFTEDTWFRHVVIPLGAGIAVFAYDITERKRTVDELKRNKAKLENLQSAGDAFVSLDRAWRFTFANDKALQFMALSREEVLGRTFWEVFPDAVGTIVDIEYRQVMKRRAPARFESNNIFNARWLEQRAFPHEDGMAIFYADITERKHIEESLRRSEAILAHAEQMAHLGAWEIDISNHADLNANSLHWSDEVYRVFGYEPGQVQVTNDFFYERVHPADRQKITDALTGAIEKQHPYSIEHRIVCPDGTERIVAEHAVITFDEQERPIRISGAVQDITERKRIEESMRQLNEDLKRRARELQATNSELEATNSELEAFAYSVSHDLRAPLNLIDQFSRLALEDYAEQLPEDGQRLLNLIHDNAVVTNRLAEDLLALSRTSRLLPKRKPLVMAEVVDQALRELEREHAGRQVEVRVGHLPPAEADPVLLKQVWLNLLSNAFKFTGRCDIAQIEIGAIAELGQVVYFVKDNGAGFDMANAERLFRAFQRLHHAEDYPGNGLGLAVIDRIIRRHGGRVWAEAQPDQGATFYFTLEGGTGRK